VSSDPNNPDRPEGFEPLSPEAWAERLSRRAPDAPKAPPDGAAAAGEPTGDVDTQPQADLPAPIDAIPADGAYPDAAYQETTYPEAARIDAASGADAGAAPDPHPWPDETAGTAEAAIVNAATSALVFQRLSVWKDELLAWFRTLLSAAVYATLIVTFGFQVARVEGESMLPTLHNQDRLIVNKLAYRLGPPRRDDIVMLYYPVNPDKSFVKRVIAEEGDTVKIEDGRVYVNDVPLDDDEYVPDTFRSHDDYPAQVIKEGYYYVLGDHRNNSSDSRHWGEVPKKYIIGRVWLRWWPIQDARIF
jgi:signal peptidase I